MSTKYEQMSELVLRSPQGVRGVGLELVLMCIYGGIPKWSKGAVC